MAVTRHHPDGLTSLDELRAWLVRMGFRATPPSTSIEVRLELGRWLYSKLLRATIC